MISFKELLLNEHAQAKKGDWKGSSNILQSQIEQAFIDGDWEKIKVIKYKGDSLDLYKNTKIKDKHLYILGEFVNTTIKTKNGLETKKEFIVQFGITFSKFSNTKTHGDLYNVDGVGSNYKKIWPR